MPSKTAWPSREFMQGNVHEAESEAARGAACRHPVVARTRWCCRARGGSSCGAAAPSGAWAVAPRRTTTRPWRSSCQAGSLLSEQPSNNECVNLRTHRRTAAPSGWDHAKNGRQARCGSLCGAGFLRAPGERHRDGPLLNHGSLLARHAFLVRAPQRVREKCSSHAAHSCWAAQIRLAGTAAALES